MRLVMVFERPGRRLAALDGWDGWDAMGDDDDRRPDLIDANLWADKNFVLAACH